MTSVEAQPLSFAVRQALIQGCGTVFHWKSGLVQLFVSSGVPEVAVTRYVDQGLAKFKIARAVLEDLDARGVAGHRVQWQIVQSMLELDGAADNDADMGEARSALAALRKAAGPRASAPGAGGDAEAVARRRRTEMQAAAKSAKANRSRHSMRASPRLRMSVTRRSADTSSSASSLSCFAPSTSSTARPTELVSSRSTERFTTGDATT
jgi:hypothetical protein